MSYLPSLATLVSMPRIPTSPCTITLPAIRCITVTLKWTRSSAKYTTSMNDQLSLKGIAQALMETMTKSDPCLDKMTTNEVESNFRQDNNKEQSACGKHDDHECQDEEDSEKMEIDMDELGEYDPTRDDHEGDSDRDEEDLEIDMQLTQTEERLSGDDDAADELGSRRL